MQHELRNTFPPPFPPPPSQGIENVCSPDVQAPFIRGEACLAICPRQSVRNLQTGQITTSPTTNVSAADTAGEQGSKDETSR